MNSIRYKHSGGEFSYCIERYRYSIAMTKIIDKENNIPNVVLKLSDFEEAISEIITLCQNEEFFIDNNIGLTLNSKLIVKHYEIYKKENPIFFFEPNRIEVLEKTIKQIQNMF